MQVLDHQAKLRFHHILQKMGDLPTLDFFPEAFSSTITLVPLISATPSTWTFPRSS